MSLVVLVLASLVIGLFIAGNWMAACVVGVFGVVLLPAINSALVKEAEDKAKREKALAKAQEPVRPLPAAPSGGTTATATALREQIDASVRRVELAAEQAKQGKAVAVPSDPSKASSQPAGQMVWHPLGAPAVVGGRTLANGGFYAASSGAAACAGAVIENLTVAARGEPDWQAANIGYWPRYTQLNASQRLAYLGYLNSPRRTTQVGQAYLWLYVYNLEFRLLIDDVEAVSDDEFSAITKELRELVKAYMEWRSVRSYLPNLIGAAAARRGARMETRAPWPPELHWSDELALKAGQAAGRGEPVGSGWALQIALLNRPVGRPLLEAVGTELRLLFEQRFDALNEKQRMPKLGRSRLRIEYQRAMDGQRMLIKCEVPDLRRQSSPFSAWVSVLDECLMELEGLRKARTNKSGTALGRLGSLPAALARTKALPKELQEAATTIKQACSEGAAAMPWGAFCEALGAKGVEPKKREVVHAAQALGLIGFGLEPDPRFGGGSLPGSGEIVLFELKGEAAGAPTEGYAAALLLVQCGYQVAGSDGLANQEADALLALVARDMELPEAEVSRLAAHMTLMGLDGARQKRVMAELKTMPEAKRHALARSMVGIAGADGEIDMAEAKMLEKLYQTVGLDVGSLHSDMHEVMAGGAPLPAQAANGAAPAGKARPRSLDGSAIARKLEETRRVQSLLATVFVEEEEEAEVVGGAESDEDVRLDLARMLAASAPGMPRSAWEVLCEGKGLLPDAALESVNEWAVDGCGDTLAEGDDPIEINTWAAGELGLPLPAEEEQ